MRIDTVLLALALASTSASAQPLYKCLNEDGTNSYQQEPCATGQVQTAAPRIDKAPTLTEAEKRRIFGEPVEGEVELTPEFIEAVRAPEVAAPPPPVRAPSLDTSPYARGRKTGARCVTPSGQVYYAQACGSSRVDVATGGPTTVWDAYHPETGEIMQRGLHGQQIVTWRGRNYMPSDVQWRTRSEVPHSSHRARHASAAVGADEACDGARRQAKQLRDSGGDFDKRQRADAAVSDLCRQGRSMWEQRQDGRDLGQ
jgi:hypothetical protein